MRVTLCLRGADPTRLQKLLVPTVPGPTMLTLTPVLQVGPFVTTPSWDQQEAVSELECAEPEVLFVPGSGRNRDRFLPYFTKIFNLRIDDDTVCVAASKSAPTTTGRLAKRESNLCSG